MSEHPFHKKIGEELRKMKLCHCEIVLDEACDNSTTGKKQQIPLFVSEKNNENALCKVDAIITCNDKIKIIIEIEESAFKPTTICGKYLTSALAKNYTDRNGNEISIPPNSVLFIQIIDLHKMLNGVKEKENSKKKEQLEIVKAAIKEIQVGSIEKYELIFINSQKPDFSEFRKLIKDYLNINY